MPNIEAKLQLFDKKIIDDAIITRNEILGQLHRDSERELSGAKEKITLEAAREYQEYTNRAQAEKDSKIAKASADSRKTLINARNGIIASALGVLTEKLAAFTQTENYRAYLFANLGEALELAGFHGTAELTGRNGTPGLNGRSGGSPEDGPAPAAGYSVYLTPRDAGLYSDEIRLRAPGVKILSDAADSIGGVKAENASTGVIVDNTLRKKAEQCSDGLFRISGLKISA